VSTVRMNPSGTNEELRQGLFSGELFVLTNLPAVAEFVEHARRELTALFAPHDPQHVHEHLDPAELAKVLADWKPKFIRHPDSIRLTKEIITQAGFDPMTAHYDLPKPRTAYPVGHLTSGIAYAFPWHRDSWYSAPTQQFNFWLPIWEPQANNAMAFDPAGFGRKVPNNSVDFNYYRRNVERASLSDVVKSDPRAQPAATDWNPDQQTIVLPSPGSVLIFAGDQLHRTIPNTSGLSRYSIDFRIVDITDIEAGRGAPGLDVSCTGTSVRDFKRVSDNAEMPDRVVRILEPTPPTDGAVLTFKPS
jgi:hypothetical protein